VSYAPPNGAQPKPQDTRLALDYMYCPGCAVVRWHRVVEALPGQPLATSTPQGWRALRFGEWMQRPLTRNSAAQCCTCGTWRLRVLPSTVCP
jgi:hypothetical protein